MLSRTHWWGQTRKPFLCSIRKDESAGSTFQQVCETVASRLYSTSDRDNIDVTVLRLIPVHLGPLESVSPLWLEPAKSLLLLNGAPIKKCLLVSFQQYLVSLNNFSDINVTRRNEFSLASIQPKLASVDSGSQKHHGLLAVLCSCEVESRCY